MSQLDDQMMNQAFYASLMLLRTNGELRKGGRRFRREAVGLPDWMFEKTCESLQRAHDYGLTRIRETVRDRDGHVVEIVFEQVLTPAGDALLDGPAPQLQLPEDTRRTLRERLERQLETGESGGSPMINGRGEAAGDLSDYLSPDQIRENAKRQLELLDEEERRIASREASTRNENGQG